MALDDASDPFQQMVYLQEGEAPDAILAYCSEDCGSRASSRWVRSIYIINVDNQTIIRRIQLPVNAFKASGSSGKIVDFISGENGDVFGVVKYSYSNDDFGFALIKVNSFTGSKQFSGQIPISEPLDGGNYGGPSGCYCNGHVYVLLKGTVTKIRASNLSTVSSTQVVINPPITASYLRFPRGRSPIIKSDGQTIFFVESLFDDPRSTIYYNPPDGALAYRVTTLYELNPNTLSFTAAFNDIQIRPDESGFIGSGVRGLTVQNGVAYLGLFGDVDGIVTSRAGGLEKDTILYSYWGYGDLLKSNENGIYFCYRADRYEAYNLNDLSKRTNNASLGIGPSTRGNTATIVGNNLFINTADRVNRVYKNFIYSWDTSTDTLNYAKAMDFPNDPRNGDPSAFQSFGYITAVRN